MDVRLLAPFDKICFNRSYIAWRQWGFAPTYYACFDPIVYEDNLDEIGSVIGDYPETHFYLPGRPGAAKISTASNISLVNLVAGEKFSSDLNALSDFGNVGASSLQILANLGYRRIAMVGVDARYVALQPAGEGSGRAELAIVDDDPDHFSAQYTRHKRVNVRPDLARILGQWPQAAKECANYGIEVRNASRGSALQCFPRSDFKDAITWLAGAA